MLSFSFVLLLPVEMVSSPVLHCTALHISPPDASDQCECTSGFMSVDKMDDILGNEGILGFNVRDAQRIFPEVTFTCNGSILSWVFGANWEGHNGSIELQIWRPGSEDGVYNKVGSTAPIVTEKTLNPNQKELFHYPLSSPLPFQAGDVLGFYQPAFPNSQSRILFDGGSYVLGQQFKQQQHRQPQLRYTYYNCTDTTSQLNVSGPGDRRYRVLINVITGESIYTYLYNTFQYNNRD